MTLKKKEAKTPRLSSIVAKRSSFIHGISVNPKAIIFNWSFYVSVTISFIIFLYNKLSIKTNKRLETLLNNNSFDIFVLSVSAIGVIIAALAILVAIFKIDKLHQIAIANERTFESFVFPYRYSATLWGMLAVGSLIPELISINMGKFMNAFSLYFWLFSLIYATLYSLYLIQEILEYILFAALVFNENESNGNKEDNKKKKEN